MKNRPDFQRLLRDIELGKIKAIACYKSDRIGAKLPILCDCLNILNGIMSPCLYVQIISTLKTAPLKLSFRCLRLLQNLREIF